MKLLIELYHISYLLCRKLKEKAHQTSSLGAYKSNYFITINRTEQIEEDLYDPSHVRRRINFLYDEFHGQWPFVKVVFQEAFFQTLQLRQWSCLSHLR